MSDVAWGVIGALGGAIIGVATTIAVDFFKRKAEKTELKISVLSALSANALKQYRLVCSVIGTTVNMTIAAATASLINTHKIAYDSEEARLRDLKRHLGDRNMYMDQKRKTDELLSVCDSELRELRIRYMVIFPKDSETPEIILEIVDYSIFNQVEFPSRETFDEAILNLEEPHNLTDGLIEKTNEIFKPILDRLKSQIDNRTRELAK